MKFILCLLCVPLCSCFINNDYEYEQDVKKLEEEKGIKNEIKNISVNAITEAEQIKNTSSFVKEDVADVAVAPKPGVIVAGTTAWPTKPSFKPTPDSDPKVDPESKLLVLFFLTNFFSVFQLVSKTYIFCNKVINLVAT
jgi:hypothetical protein